MGALAFDLGFIKTTTSKPGHAAISTTLPSSLAHHPQKSRGILSPVNLGDCREPLSPFALGHSRSPRAPSSHGELRKPLTFYLGQQRNLPNSRPCPPPVSPVCPRASKPFGILESVPRAPSTKGSLEGFRDSAPPEAYLMSIAELPSKQAFMLSFSPGRARRTKKWRFFEVLRTSC